MGDVIRPEVAAAAAFAPMKAEEEWSDDEMARFGEPLHAITPPVNSAERQLLLGLLTARTTTTSTALFIR